ncbi:MAG: ThiF family adenylyltransferase, partial [Proteobacteria bacterium]|nr:ThiF family adenylyltransferase [Pseudomonadota bacterium]
MWSKQYRQLSDRNIGLLSEEQQGKLKSSCVAVAGLGGIGSVPAEILARTGIESFKLLDNETFEPTNSNRQIFSFVDTNGKYKTEVTEEYLQKINPDIKTEKFLEITEKNAGDFLRGVDALVLGIDSVIPCLVLSRAARELRIPIIEGWALAFANVRVFTNDTPTLEEVYGFPTVGKEISSITEEEAKELLVQSLMDMQEIDGLREAYPRAATKRLLEKGEGTTFAPMVWMS